MSEPGDSIHRIAVELGKLIESGKTERKPGVPRRVDKKPKYSLMANMAWDENGELDFD